METVRQFVKRAGIPDGKWSFSFQSRLGRDPWMEPYTDQEIARLAKAGVKKLLVICPAFVTDCLETLEEISMEGRDIFLDSGGQDLHQIPCLNCHPKWVDLLAKRCCNWAQP
ncbi:MAG: ferrochelatase [Opitutales bacterium]